MRLNGLAARASASLLVMEFRCFPFPPDLRIGPGVRMSFAPFTRRATVTTATRISLSNWWWSILSGSLVSSFTSYVIILPCRAPCCALNAVRAAVRLRRVLAVRHGIGEGRQCTHLPTLNETPASASGVRLLVSAGLVNRLRYSRFATAHGSSRCLSAWPE
jgi:hypothetical protein